MVLETFNTPRLQQISQKIKETNDESKKQKFLKNLVLVILDKIDGLNLKSLEDGVDVKNLDEVRAHLRNELNRANKPIATILKDLVKVASKKEEQKNKIEVTNLKDKIEVSNLKDIEIPKDVSINNLRDLENEIKSLGDIIKESLNVNIEVPEPKVILEPPVVNIPETVIKPTDLEPVTKQIRKSLKKLETNKKTNPLAVRMTDGQEWIKEVQNTNELLVELINGFVQYQSDVQKLKNKKGSTINPATEDSVAPPSAIGDGSKAVTTAGTAVQLTATLTPCKKVIITGSSSATGKIYIGGSGVSSSTGTFIYSSQTLQLDIDDVSKVYIDTDVNGEGIQYTYVS